MMKITCVLSSLAALACHSQLLRRKTQNSSHPWHRRIIFANYHYDLTEGAEPNNKFEIQRVYLNFKAKMTEDFSARVTTDVGTLKNLMTKKSVHS